MNNKKIISVLTALLIVAMAVPVFADGHMEENVKITGEVTTIFQVGSYDDEVDAAANLWADGEVLDDPDMDEYPAKKAFYQEIGFNVAGMVNENINFDLAVDTLANNFTATATENSYGDQGADSTDLAMDTATLTVGDDVSTMKLGDVSDFHADYTFIDEEDREGMTLDTVAMGSDVSAFVLGNNDNGVADFYGMTATRDLGTATATAKVLNAQDYARMNVMNLVGALEADVTDMIAVNGKLVMNSSENLATNSDKSDKSDTFMSAGMTANMNEALTVNGTMEMVGEDFEGVADDTEGANTEMYKVDADYALGAANTVSGAYTLVADDDKDEDKSTIEASLENVMGAYTNTASISMTTNDEFAKDSDVTVMKVGTEYALDYATASAELTNKSADADKDLTYLTAGLDQQISENVNWNTTVDYVTGTNTADVDSVSTSLETALTVSF
jgi:hypothetical protein